MRSHAQWGSFKLFFKGCLGGVDNTLNTLDYNVLADFHGYTFITQTFINYNKLTPLHALDANLFIPMVMSDGVRGNVWVRLARMIPQTHDWHSIVKPGRSAKIVEHTL